jgi:hypothetical protein
MKLFSVFLRLGVLLIAISAVVGGLFVSMITDKPLSDVMDWPWWLMLFVFDLWVSHELDGIGKKIDEL